MMLFITKLKTFLSEALAWGKIILCILLGIGVVILVYIFRSKVGFLLSGLRNLLGAVPKNGPPAPAEGASTTVVNSTVTVTAPPDAGDNSKTSQKVINNIDSLLAEIKAARG
jgi:hypothetical protein